VAQSQQDMPAPGVHIVGEYIGLRDQRPRTKTYNDLETVYQGCDVGLRIDGEVVTVGFPDRRAAEEAVAGWSLGDLRSLAVRPLHGVNQNGPWLLWSAVGTRAVAENTFSVPA
jgi:hypothetical protein